MFSVATPDTQLTATSTSKATEKVLNTLQKQIYKIENSECASTHPIERTISTCCYRECLSGYEHILLKRLYQFVATANVYLDTTKLS